MDRLDRLALLGSHRIRLETDRGLHRGQREQLEQMVRYHVAERSGAIVEFTAAFDRDRLGHRDLHVIDMVAVPQRLEQPVGEPQHHDVLDRLLPEIMVDAIDLVFRKDRQQLCIERARRIEIGSERLFDDEPAPGVLLAGQARLAELLGSGREYVRRCRQVEQAIAADREPAFHFGQPIADPAVGLPIVEIAAHVKEAFEQTTGDVRDDLAGSELTQGRAHRFAKLLVRHLCASDPDHGKAFGQQAFGREIVKRGDEQPFGEVPRRPENDEGARIGRMRPVLPDGAVLRGDVHHEPRDFGSTCPPKPLRIAERKARRTAHWPARRTRSRSSTSNGLRRNPGHSPGSSRASDRMQTQMR